MIDTSAILGTFEISEVPSASKQAAINLSTEFFAPGTSTRPERSPARRTVMSGPVSMMLGSNPGPADTANSMLRTCREVSAPSSDGTGAKPGTPTRRSPARVRAS